jgi:hypothetical protein
MEQAVIDRFEEGWAVILVGDDERRVDVRRDQLPAGAGEGDWLQVDLREDRLVQAILDEAATAQARRRIHDKLERLRRGDHLR